MCSGHVVGQVGFTPGSGLLTVAVRSSQSSRAGFFDKVGGALVSRWEMIAVSQLDSGSERRPGDSHILYAATSVRMMDYVLPCGSGSGPSAAPVDRMVVSNFQVCDARSDLPKSCCGAWTPRRPPEARRVLLGEASGTRGQLARAARVPSSDGPPLSLSQKSAPWTNL